MLMLMLWLLVSWYLISELLNSLVPWLSSPSPLYIHTGMSYVMDFAKSEDIQEDDVIDEYPGEQIQCVVDAKSMLYLYGLELDYSNELIGGGFKFYNPNAEESCGCGSSFAV